MLRLDLCPPLPQSCDSVCVVCLCQNANISLYCICPSQSQGFQVVCEAARSDSSSSPASAEQSCRRGNSVEKGGPSQQPPPVKGPSKKK